MVIYSQYSEQSSKGHRWVGAGQSKRNFLSLPQKLVLIHPQGLLSTCEAPGNMQDMEGQRYICLVFGLIAPYPAAALTTIVISQLLI